MEFHVLSEVALGIGLEATDLTANVSLPLVIEQAVLPLNVQLHIWIQVGTSVLAVRTRVDLFLKADVSYNFF